MKDYLKVLPDKVKLLQKHFTPGRGGYQIEYIVRHHLAGIGTTEDVWQWWQTRQASAHYVVETTGIVGQIVWDNDTAWANADSIANRKSLTIEHSNISGAPAWSITNETIMEGARLAAALCLFYGLGRPVFGRNIRDHRDFFATSCPHNLAFGQKYHDAWMKEAQRFYDVLLNPTIIEHEDVLAIEEENILSALTPSEQREVLDGIRLLKKALIAPLPSLVEGSAYAADVGTYVRQVDRKVEELHVEYAGRSTKTQIEADEAAATPETFGEGKGCDA